jgi:hypothetical protein
MTNSPDPAKTSPLRPGDREPQTYFEIGNREQPDQAKPSSSVPRLPDSSPWSDPKNFGPDEPPIDGSDCA